ncbi:hypothetical protein ScPMuIL_008914 [Solemya velum]
MQQVVTSVFLLLCLVEDVVSEYCSEAGKYCYHGCCDWRCCDVEEEDSVSGAVIAFAVVGTVLGIGAIIACVCCFVRRKGYGGTVFRRDGQTAFVGGQSPYIPQQHTFIGGQPGYVVGSQGVNATVIHTNTNPGMSFPVQSPAPASYPTSPPPYGFTNPNGPNMDAPPPPYPGVN